MAEKPSPQSFLRALTTRWLDSMSGQASVPLTLAAFIIPNRLIAIGTGILGYGCLIFSSYRVWSAERERVVELEKVDRDDLQHMLGGRYYGNSFVYSSEVTLCKDYTGRFDLERLKDGFDMISVCAPRNASASIKLQFLNGHEGSGKHAFYYLDGHGNVSKIENIYEPLSIYLNDQCQFGLKLICDDGYKINDLASLLVTVKSWSK